MVKSDALADMQSEGISMLHFCWAKISAFSSNRLPSPLLLTISSTHSSFMLKTPYMETPVQVIIDLALPLFH